MEKTIFQVAFTETIVFSSYECDTIISFSGSGLRWWFVTEEGKLSLADTLYVNNDLNRATIAYARKLATDWFTHELNNFTQDGSSDSSEEMVTTTYSNGEAINTSIVSVSGNGFPMVVPPFLDADKKDAHTEHCCSAHRKCKYGNRRCTVVSGEKKASYPCNCGS